MPCSGCPKGKIAGPSSNPARSQAMMAQAQAQSGEGDISFIMALYNHPNRGSHRVVGGAIFQSGISGVNFVRREGGFSIDYGWRGGGEKFLVHVADIKAQPHLFIPVRQEQPVRVISTPTVPPPPPKLDSEIPPDLSPAETAPVVAVLAEDKEFDLQLIPGVTPLIAQQLRENGIKTPQDILLFGNAGLVGLKGIGPSRAAMILSGAQKRVDG